MMMSSEVRVGRSFGYLSPSTRLSMHPQFLSDSPLLPAEETPAPSELECMLSQACSSSSVLRSPVLDAKLHNAQNHNVTLTNSRRIRRLRPHSSPVRLETKLQNAQNYHISSPSSRRIHRRRPHSSPDRRKGVVRSVGTPLPMYPQNLSGLSSSPAEVTPYPPDLESILSQAYNSSTGVPAHVTGYFSARPPIMPLQLVPIRLFGNHEKEEDYLDDKPSKEPSAQSMDNTLRSFLSKGATELSRSALSKNTVSSPTKNLSNPEKQGCSPTHSRLASSSSGSGSRTVRCNVATQIQSLKNEDAFSHFCPKQIPLKQANEWLGGVRALRDSHVRLVLRQLRHIDRLNRALDRVLPAQRLCRPDTPLTYNK